MHRLPFFNILRRNSVAFNSGNIERIGDNSFVNLGRNYEEKCSKVLCKIFDTPVKMVGGANDGGIDLVWSKCFKGEEEEVCINFIGQCKVKFNSRVTPEVCRALDGVLSRKPSNCVGCLITNFRPSINAMKSMKYSSFPQIYFSISECYNFNYVKEIFINEKFKELYPNIHILPVRNPNYKHFILKFQ